MIFLILILWCYSTSINPNFGLVTITVQEIIMRIRHILMSTLVATVLMACEDEKTEEVTESDVENMTRWRWCCGCRRCVP